MQDLKSHKAIWLKGVAFLAIAVTACVLLLVDSFSIRTALLLVLAIWASCRAYYFAFYVIQNYVDPQFRFSGLGAFVVYAIKKVLRS